MPWGKHKGTAMANLPAAYLLWCYHAIYFNRPDTRSPVSIYIHDNLDDLKAEMKKQ